MSEPRYTNRQIEMFLSQLRDYFSTELSQVIQPLTAQVTKTNGTVSMLTKLVYMAMGALIILTPWAMWVTETVLKLQAQKVEPVTQADIDEAVERAINSALEAY